MNTKRTTLALMAALALGGAHAASAGTTAGTAINNTATSVYDDPGGGVTGLTTTSNTVTTLVNPVTGFDVLYSDSSADDTSATTPAATYDKGNILPAGTVTTKYRVVNNGNVNNYVVNLSADTTGSATALPATAPSNGAGGVQYFLDTNEDGTPDSNTPITSVTLTNGGTQGIVQVITLPDNAPSGAQYSATPKGTAPAGSVVVGGTTLSYTAYNESSNQNTPGTPATNGDLQYTRATTYSPTAVVGPSTYPAAGASGSYTDPSQNTVTISRSGDTQTAAVAFGSTTTTFINTLKNTGALTDSYVLTSTTPTGGTVEFKTPSGATITAGGVTEGGITYKLVSGAVQVQNVPSGSTADVRTVVIYGSTAGAQNFVLSIESLSDVNTTAEDTTTNTVNVPGLLFGDKTNTGPDASLNPNPSVSPGSTASVNMQIKNSGGASDTFSFSSQQVQFQVVDASGTISTQNVAVTYTADATCSGSANGTLPLALASGATGCVIATVNVPSNALKGVTPAFTQTATGATSTATATDTNDTITVPLIFASTPSNKGVVMAKFTAKSGVVAGTETESNSGLTNPAGYTLAQTTASLKTNVSYRIIAKNVYNTNVTKFFIKDTVPTNTTLNSIALTRNGTAVADADTIYSTDGGTTWTALTTAITSKAAGTNYQVAVDTDHDNVPDTLGPNSTLQLDFVVTLG